jgi:FG-GAP-like repeat/FG-GAP repeat
LSVNTSNGISIFLGMGNAALPFKPGTNITLSGAGCVVTGDLNGDGIPNLLVPSSTTVAAYLGSGKGTFTEAGSTPTTTEGYIAVGDFNHDGKLDFATSANLIALGNGDGTFEPVTALIPGAGTFTNIAVGDLNNDGWPDILLTNQFGESLTELLNNQQGGFNESVITTALNGPGDLEPTQTALADLNGDGNLDIVTAGIGGAAFAFMGNGQGGFTYLATVEGSSSLGFESACPTIVVDVNGDGIPDINVDCGGTVELFLGEGNGMFEAPIYVGTYGANDIVAEPLHGQAADLADLVVMNSTGLSVLINLTK